MKTFLRILVLIAFTLIILSFFVTRDGYVVTPIGDGQVILDSGTYEAFPLPIYASNMVDSNYKSYFIEVEQGLKVHVIEAGEGFPVFLMRARSYSAFTGKLSHRRFWPRLPLNPFPVNDDNDEGSGGFLTVTFPCWASGSS